MKIHRLERKLGLPISISEAWEFFSDPKNLEKITPQSMGFTILTDLPQKIHPGMIIQYKVSPLLNIPMTWVSEISHVIENKLFVDEQRFGPYNFWHHKHYFEETNSGTLVSDVVDYVMPFGPFGNIAHCLFVKKQLNGIFDYRSKVLLDRFGSVAEQL